VETKTTPTQGFPLVRDGGALIDLPAFLVGREVVGWPPVMPEKEPGEPVQYFSDKDLYHRHLLLEENVYRYVNSERDAHAVAEEVLPEIHRRLGRG